MSSIQSFPDFVAGLVAYEGFCKSCEIRSFTLTFIVILLLFSLIGWISSKYETTKKNIPAYNIFLTVSAAYTFWGIFTFNYIAATTFLLVTIYLASANDLKKIARTKIIISIFAFSFCLFASATAIKTFFAFINRSDITSDYQLYFDSLSSYIICSILISISAALLIITNNQRKTFKNIALLIQVPLPLLLIRMTWVKWFQGSSNTTVLIEAEYKLWIIILLVAVSHLLILIKNFRSKSNSFLALTTAAIIGAYIGFYLPPSSTFWIDDFHLGEISLPYHQIFQKGLKYYDEFVPIQGLMGVTEGSVAANIFHQAFSGIILARSLVNAVACFLIILAFSFTTSPAVALLLTPIATSFPDRFALSTPLFILLSSNLITKNSSRYILCAATFAIASVIWVPTSGIALGAGVTPVCLFAIYKTFNRSKTEIVLLGFGLATICILSLLLTPLLGAIEMILDNGSTNLVAHGTQFIINNNVTNPSIHSLISDIYVSRVVWEIIRIGGWMLSCGVLSFLVLRSITVVSAKNQLSALAPLIGAITFVFMMISYSLVRIDGPEFLSRTGGIMQLSVGIFLPLGLYISSRYFKITNLILLISAILISANLIVINPDLKMFFYKAGSVVQVEKEFISTSTLKYGDKLGAGFIYPAKYEAIDRLKKAFDEIKTKDSIVADLSNRGALFRYLDETYPNLYPSFVAASARAQNRIVKSFIKNPPIAVLIDPFLEIDAATAAERTYRVYRWLIENGYVFYEKYGYRFLLRKDRALELLQKDKNTISDLRALEQIFHPHWLRKLPMSWGQSIDSLSKKSKIFDLPIKGHLEDPKNSNTLIIECDPKDLIQTDFIAMNFDRLSTGSKNTKFSISFKINETEFSKPFLFDATQGAVVVPFGTNPFWLSYKKLGVFRIEFPHERTTTKWKVTQFKAIEIPKIY